MPPVLGWHQAVICPVQHQGGSGNSGHLVGTISGFEDSHQVALHGLRVKPTISNGLLAVRFGFTRRQVAQSILRLVSRRRQMWRIGCRHNRDQAAGLFGVLGRHNLGNHAPHGGAHNMRLIVAHRVHEAGNVGPHVVQRVRRVD